MSPHATHSSPSSTASCIDDLQQFSITPNAFLPDQCPPPSLSDSYYEPWEVIARQLPELIKSGSIRQTLSQLPLLQTTRLTCEAEWRRAYLILTFFAHAYIWGGEKPAEVLPPQLTVPLLEVAEHVELPPGITYAGANLWNFECSGTDFTKLDDMSVQISFTGTESEAWFFLVGVAIEATASGLIPVILSAYQAIKTRDYDVITQALGELCSCIKSAGSLVDRMHEKCDPMVFYHQIRPFLAGSKNMEAAGLPKGVFYDEGNGQGTWRKYQGGSNGQSPLVPLFDIVLDVDHSSGFYRDAREYMPGPHRRFLEHLSTMGSIRQLALQHPTTDAERRLQVQYTAAIDALTEFRNKHLQIVTRYVILPAKKPFSGQNRQNLATSSSESKDKEGLKGTGGTTLIPFLKNARDETIRAGRIERDVAGR